MESSRSSHRLFSVLLLLLLFILLTALLFILRLPVNVTEAPVGDPPALQLSRLLSRVQNETLSGLVTVKKIYRLPEDMLVAPAPDPAGYLTSSDPEEIAAEIEKAASLLDGQQTVWTKDTPFLPQYGVHLYRDESILALVWTEEIDDLTCTFSEVVLADASQFRRKLSCDEYGTGGLKFPSDMAVECNAVLASSADFYRFRPVGVNFYQRELYRCVGDQVDTCWVTASGDLLFTRAGEILNEEQARAYARENDVLFTVCFGPVMVEDGQNVVTNYYYLGEQNEDYSRSCIAQVEPGRTHYLLCMVKEFLTVRSTAAIMVDKGVDRCYALDGGQTGTVVMEGTMLNPSVYGYGNAAQRIQSDIIYFATAIPEQERGK